MNILSVIPIYKGAPKGELSYFSAKEIHEGALVSVPIRKKNVPALVVSSKNLREEKATLKNAHFNIRKITKMLGFLPFDQALVDTLIKCAPYFGASTGQILESFIPAKILESLPSLSSKEKKVVARNNEKSEVLLFQAPLYERIAHYKILIRQLFARKQSIYFIVPTKADVDFYVKEFSKGIEPYTFRYKSDISNKEVQILWNKKDGEHSLLIIGTPSAICFERNDTALIIIEHERSRVYKTLSYPFIDNRLIIERYAREAKIPCVIGDSLLRTETVAEKEKYTMLRQTSLRLPELSEIKIESLKDENGFHLISKMLTKALINAEENNEHIFLFVPRKGLAPVTVCNDCANIVRCSECDAPLVLYKKGKERVYSCNRCGHTEDSTRKCTNCDSWNLVPLGIGTETVKEAILDLNIKTPVYIIDKEHIETKKDVTKIIDEFYNSPSGILIATEYALPLMRERVDRVAIVTLDTLFSIPHFRMDESILGLIITLSERAKAPLLIQTDRTESEIFNYMKNGNLTLWQKNSILEREQLGYPPFGHILTLKARGNKIENRRYRTLFEKEFVDYHPHIHTNTLSKTKEIFETTMLIKTTKKEWPQFGAEIRNSSDFPLYEKVMSMCLPIRFEIDPDSVI